MTLQIVPHLLGFQAPSSSLVQQAPLCQSNVIDKDKNKQTVTRSGIVLASPLRLLLHLKAGEGPWLKDLQHEPTSLLVVHGGLATRRGCISLGMQHKGSCGICWCTLLPISKMSTHSFL